MSYRECSKCGYVPSQPVHCAGCGGEGTMRTVDTTRAEVASLRAQLAQAREALERVTNALKEAVEWLPDDAEWKDGSTEQWVMRSIPVGRNALRALLSGKSEGGGNG